jgi:ADP-ribose pyrophosphatase
METPAGRVNSRQAYVGRLLKVDVDTVRAPDGSTVELEIVRHPGASAVVPVLSDPGESDPTILMLRQYRYAGGGTMWEIPAGVLQPGEDPLACARRELAEETGATAKTIEHLTTIHTTPGFTDERIHLYWATGVVGGTPRHEPDEFIEIRVEKLSRVLQLIGSGEVSDAKTIVALLFVAGFKMGL